MVVSHYVDMVIILQLPTVGCTTPYTAHASEPSDVSKPLRLDRLHLALQLSCLERLRSPALLPLHRLHLLHQRLVQLLVGCPRLLHLSHADRCNDHEPNVLQTWSVLFCLAPGLDSHVFKQPQICFVAVEKCQ